MLTHSADNPRISGLSLALFSWYARFYFRRHFHALRIVRGSAPSGLDDRPLIVCLNHPSWWDPLIALTLARETFPDRVHYAPIDSISLTKYRFFERLGFFGIDPKSVRGASRFLKVGRAILAQPRTTLWITSEGTFTDVRTRPVSLRSGIGHLVHSLDEAVVVPLALEYVFWHERAPEALACWGEPLPISGGSQRRPDEWTQEISCRLEKALNRLGDLSMRREKAAFDVLLSGSAGVGGVYDVWRSLRARLTGQPFTLQHGSERF